ncbi:hypothetical protein [Azospirillum sp. TSH58]|uniref:hypothetical protein n=1 Tax=Azospirillum sp. TSH58 TaxID=664962 RepID=UPI0011B26A72|nr:hypothetical protein [Azospirillum sp. TSH58]
MPAPLFPAMTAPPPHPRPIRIHSLTEADIACAAAADLGVPLLLVSAPGAAASAGAGWFREVVARAAARHPSVAMTAVLDCADRPGDALGALSAGVAMLLFSGRADVAERLADIAAQRGAHLLTALPDALDLRRVRDPRRACRDWLSGQDDGHVTE